MAWVFLFIAGLFEIGFAICLRLSDNFSRLWPTLGFVGFSILSFICMGASLKQIPVGTAYAVWTGIGATGVALLGVIFFNDPISFWEAPFLSTLILSLIGLKLASA
jgi:quaternary ammonium compound-resistance protein SugE